MKGKWERTEKGIAIKTDLTTNDGAPINIFITKYRTKAEGNVVYAVKFYAVRYNNANHNYEADWTIAKPTWLSVSEKTALAKALTEL